MKLNIEKIKMLRLENKMTLMEMARLLGYKSPTGYFYIESGNRNFKPEHLPLISKHFGVSIDSLYLESEFANTANSKL